MKHSEKLTKYNDMEENNLFNTIQKAVFEYCEKIDKTELILLIDSFVFETRRENLNKTYFKNFITAMKCEKSYEDHISDIENKPYFLKCSGANLKYLEYLNTALLVFSYNVLRKWHVKNFKRRKANKNE